MEPKATLHVSAENANLPGAKVGGGGDVVRDVSIGLARQGCNVITCLPSHGFLHKLPLARHVGALTPRFEGQHLTVEVFEVSGRIEHPNLRNFVLHHPRLTHPGDPPPIFKHDPPDRPFASDATKSALFGAAVVTALKRSFFGNVSTVHLHDWHASFVRALVEIDSEAVALRRLRWVLTIHNLALQGVRPLTGDASSWKVWFPHL